MSPAYIGADPGAGGALALWIPARVVELEVIDMPVFEINGKRRIDLYGLARHLVTWLDLHRDTHEFHAIVENVGAMPGQSPNGMFAFGFSAGALQSAVASAGIPMTLVVPQVWKRVYGIPGGRENKDVARQRASQVFPKYAHLWARKKDDGRAEAALLAHYGSKLT